MTAARLDAAANQLITEDGDAIHLTPAETAIHDKEWTVE